MKSLPLSLLLVSLSLSHYYLLASGYITWIEARIPLKGEEAKPGTPWPYPQKWLQSNVQLTLSPSLFFFSSEAAAHCDVMASAITRYRGLIFPKTQRRAQRALGFPELREVRIVVENNANASDYCDYPQFGDDESYYLHLTPGAPGLIQAKSIWGALRGLETFSQLVLLPGSLSRTAGAYLVNATKITDWPRYPYRGLLLDTARHFIPKRTILKNLDAMAYNKLNVFHWHLVDDQAYPMESKRFPDLSARGAFSPRHVYSQRDMKEVIDYARMRGVRVLPEIDSPGHTRALGLTFPDLLTPCYGHGLQGPPRVPNYPTHSEAEILNPLLNKTYAIMTELFAEVRSIFPDKFIHLGMDEVYYGCWASNPDILEFMERNNLSGVNQVEQYYVRNTLINVKNLGYSYMTWQDPVDNGVRLADDAIVEVWKDVYLDSTLKPWQEYIEPIARQGYRIVVSAPFYLNYIRYPYPGMDWELYYKCDIRNFTGTPAEKNLVVGGEACMWAEFVDGTNLLSRMWPRASAVAERLWTDPAFPDEDSARFRLDQQRCRMVQRGIPASPILNGFCGDYEWDMDAQPEPVNSGDIVL